MIRIGIAPQANTPTGTTSSGLLSALEKQQKLQKKAPATDTHSCPLLCSLKFHKNSSVVLHPTLNQGMDPARRKKKKN